MFVSLITCISRIVSISWCFIYSLFVNTFNTIICIFPGLRPYLQLFCYINSNSAYLQLFCYINSNSVNSKTIQSYTAQRGTVGNNGSNMDVSSVYDVIRNELLQIWGTLWKSAQPFSNKKRWSPKGSNWIFNNIINGTEGGGGEI